MKVFGIKVLKILFWVACGAVSILSMLPGQYIPGVFDWWDKAQHAIAFAALSGLGLFGYNKVNHRVIVGLLLFGAVIEFAQAATGWRYGEWQDWLADAVGIGSAFLAWLLWKYARTLVRDSSN